MIRFGAPALALVLTACNAAGPQTPPPAPAASSSSYANLPAGVSPPGFRLPEGAGCSGAVARYDAIIDNDLNSGHVSQSVFTKIKGEISQAAAACQAGRDAEAEAMVRASRSRHGYPQG